MKRPSAEMSSTKKRPASVGFDGPFAEAAPLPEPLQTPPLRRRRPLEALSDSLAANSDDGTQSATLVASPSERARVLGASPSEHARLYAPDLFISLWDGLSEEQRLWLQMADALFVKAKEISEVAGLSSA